MVDANYKPQMGDIIEGKFTGMRYEVTGFSPCGDRLELRVVDSGDPAGASLTADGTLAVPDRFTLIRTVSRKVEVGDIWKLNATGAEWEVIGIEGSKAKIRSVRDSTNSWESVSTVTGSFSNDKAWTFVSSRAEKVEEVPAFKRGDRVRFIWDGKAGTVQYCLLNSCRVLWDKDYKAGDVLGRIEEAKNLRLLYSPSEKAEPSEAQAAIDEIDKLRAVLIAEVEERQAKLRQLKSAKNKLMAV